MGGVADGVQQVGLAQAHPAVEEERVVGLARVFGHGHAGGVRQAVAGADHEVFKGVAGIQGDIGLADDRANDFGGFRVTLGFDDTIGFGFRLGAGDDKAHSLPAAQSPRSTNG